jgi:hypothetical protein
VQIAPAIAHHLCSDSQVSLLMTVKSMPSERPSRSSAPWASSSGELSMAPGRGAMCWIFSGLQTVAGSPLVSRLKLAYSAHLSNHLARLKEHSWGQLRCRASICIGAPAKCSSDAQTDSRSRCVYQCHRISLLLRPVFLFRVHDGCALLGGGEGVVLLRIVGILELRVDVV